MSPRLLAFACLGLCACAGGEPMPPAGGGPSQGGGVDLGSPTDLATAGDLAAPDLGYAPSPLVAARPYDLHVPQSATFPAPVLLSLHGYSADASVQDAYMHLTELSDQFGFILAQPNGTKDLVGKRFWNANDACCDWYNSGVDDTTYLSAVLTDVTQRYAVDPKRVFVFGHSNGAFMAHRLACDHADQIAGIVTLSGMMWKDPAQCQPTQKVSVLQIHGTLDNIVAYGGGGFAGTGGLGTREYPSAHTTVATWAARNGCDAALTDSGMTINLDRYLPFAETKIERHQNCAGGAAELWTINGGGHIPNLTDDVPRMVWQFLASHARP